MKALRPGQYVLCVWSRDPALDISEAERREEATDADGKPSLEGRMLPFEAYRDAVREGCFVFHVRPLTLKEAERLPELKNPEIVKIGLCKLQEHGGETFAGEELHALIDEGRLGWELLGDLAHGIVGVSRDPFFRHFARTGAGSR